MLTHTSESWTIPRTSSQRESAIETALFAVAIGEGFGMNFEGLSAKAASSKASNLANRIESIASSRHGLGTFAAISAGQALLGCRSSPTSFAQAMGRRLTGHSVLRAIPSLMETLLPFGLGSDRSFRQGRLGSIDRLLPAIVFMTPILQGTTNRVSPWMKGLFESAFVSSARDFDLASFGKLLARAAQYSLLIESPNDFDSQSALEWLVAGSKERSVQPWLKQLEQRLHDYGNKSTDDETSNPARNALPSDPRQLICDAILLWLKHHNDWQAGMLAAASLGGPTSARCAMFSGLVGILSDGECLPAKLVKKHRWFPIGSNWIDHFIDRLLQWPHGEDDLVQAHGIRSPIISLSIAHKALGLRMAYQQLRAIVS
jgi:hypothetical protein